MKLRNLMLTLGVAGLLAPAALLAADTTAPAAPKEKTKASAPCERISGSIIRPTMKNGCKPTAQPFRTYTAEDLERTGETDLNQALRKVDTIFR